MARFGLRDGQEQDADGNWRVRLIETGWVRALPAEQIRAGMTRLYNYGARETIAKVERKGRWVTIIVVDKNGVEWRQRLRHDSPLPVLECQPIWLRNAAKGAMLP